MLINRDFSVVRDVVRGILQAPDLWSGWELQGFGMLRLRLPDGERLHIWDPAGRVEGVSDCHNHPWDFQSLVVSGAVRNWRYEVADKSEGEPYWCARILCGVHAELRSDPFEVYLKRTVELVGQGSSYSMKHDELHSSEVWPGSVTLIGRVFQPDPDHAQVYWKGERRGWVPAAPRPATAEEVNRACALALSLWTEIG